MSRKAGNRMMKTALQMLELIAFLSQFLEKNILYKKIKYILKTILLLSQGSSR